MIFALQTSGKYFGGNSIIYNSIEYILVHGAPGDRVVMWDQKMQGDMSWDEWAPDALTCRSLRGGGGTMVDPMLCHYFEHYDGQPLTMLSNGMLGESDIRKPADFDEYLRLRHDKSIENVTWFNPFLCELGYMA